MVLHWIANPGPSGHPGSIPGAGVFLSRQSLKSLAITTHRNENSETDQKRGQILGRSLQSISSVGHT